MLPDDIHPSIKLIVYIIHIVIEFRKLFYLHLLIPTLLLPAKYGSTKKIHRNVVAFLSPYGKRKVIAFFLKSLKVTYLLTKMDCHEVLNLKKIES